MSNENLARGRYLPDGKLNVAGRWKSPGPGKYLLPSCTGFINHDFTLEKRPAYTIGKKCKDLTYDSSTPGPVYLPRADITKYGRTKSASAYITSRPSDNHSWISPGPSDYNPEKIKSSSPAFTIGTKHSHLDIPAHPVGPNQYSLPNTIGHNNFETSIRTAPKFSLSSRNKFMSITYGMDNSAKTLYNPKIEQVKTRPPKWTIIGRNFVPVIDKHVPAPNQYSPEKVKLSYKSSPAITMGIRHSELCSSGFPEND